MPKITDPALLQQLNGQQQGSVTIGRPNVRKEAREDAQLDVSQGQLGVAQGNLAVRQATLGSEVAKAQADARKAEIEANRAAAEAAKAPSPETGMIQQQLQTDSVLQLLNKARGQIGQGWNTGNVFGSKAFQGVPILGQGATDLDTTLTGIGGNVIKDVLAQLKAQSSTGASGFGSLTEREGTLLQSSIAALQQKQSGDSLLENLARVERHYRNALALINKEDPRRPEVQERYGILTEEDRKKEVPGAKGTVTSEGNAGADPALRGTNASVARMVKNGRSEQEVRAYLNAIRPGMGDAAEGIGSVIDYHNQNPDWSPVVDVEKVWQPASGLSSALGDVGMSPLGAGVIGAADMITGSNLDSMTGNPELTRAAMAGVQEENPNSYLLGQIGGGAMAGIGAEMGLARAGLAGARGSRVADALYGGLVGAGQSDAPDDSRVMGALLGSGAGVAGGMVGRGVTSGLGRAVSGVADPIRRTLNEAGISMTPGQILGGGIARTEDRLSGIPIVGDQIRARRTEGFEDFNNSVFNQALEPIGGGANGIGQGGVLNNQQAISQAYRDALGGQSVNIGVPEAANITAATDAIGGIPRVGPEVADTVRQIFDPAYLQGGRLTGENMQPIVQELRGLRSSYATDPLGNRVGNAINDVETALTDVFRQQAPDVMPGYDAANAAYRNQSVVNDAVLKALNNPASPGTFTPAQLGVASRSNTINFGGRNAAARGDMPFNDIQQAAQQVLPSQIPDSGTAGRMLIPAAAASIAGGGGAVVGDDAQESAGYGATSALVAALLASAPYSATSRNALQRLMLAERPQAVQQIGDALIGSSDIAGLLAAPALATWATGQ